jgi:hypothetical protein
MKNISLMKTIIGPRSILPDRPAFFAGWISIIKARWRLLFSVRLYPTHHPKRLFFPTLSPSGSPRFFVTLPAFYRVLFVFRYGFHLRFPMGIMKNIQVYFRMATKVNLRPPIRSQTQPFMEAFTCIFPVMWLQMGASKNNPFLVLSRFEPLYHLRITMKTSNLFPFPHGPP